MFWPPYPCPEPSTPPDTPLGWLTDWASARSFAVMFEGQHLTTRQVWNARYFARSFGAGAAVRELRREFAEREARMERGRRREAWWRERARW